MKHVWEELWTQTFWFWALESSTKTLKTFEHYKAPLKLFISVHSKEIPQEIIMFTLEWNLLNTSYEVFEEMTWGHFVITVDYGFVYVCVCVTVHAFGRLPTRTEQPSRESWQNVYHCKGTNYLHIWQLILPVCVFPVNQTHNFGVYKLSIWCRHQ